MPERYRRRRIKFENPKKPPFKVGDEVMFKVDAPSTLFTRASNFGTIFDSETVYTVATISYIGRGYTVTLSLDGEPVAGAVSSKHLYRPLSETKRG